MTAKIRAAPTRLQPLECARYRRRVMRKIIVHSHSANLTEQFHAPLNPFKFAQGSNSVLRHYSRMPGRRNCSDRIIEVVAAGMIPGDDAL